MDGRDIQSWLRLHADDILAFTDFEATVATDDDLLENLGGCWFRDPLWNEPGYRFMPLGLSGSGGEVAVWAGHDGNAAPSVVFFGSEGGRGVLAPSPLAFAQALAHGPIIVESRRPDPTAPSLLSIEENWFFTRSDAQRVAAARDALARYRGAVEQRFGAIPMFETLTAVGVRTVGVLPLGGYGAAARCRARAPRGGARCRGEVPSSTGQGGGVCRA